MIEPFVSCPKYSFFVWYSENVFSQGLIFIKYLISCDLRKIFRHVIHIIMIEFKLLRFWNLSHLPFSYQGDNGHFISNTGHFESNVNWRLEWLSFAYHGNNNGKAFRFEQRTCRNSSSSCSPDHSILKARI